MALLISRHNLIRRRFLALALAVLASLLVLTAPAHAQRSASFDEVKAAFVFQFANYVTWPAEVLKDGSTPIVIGIVGNDEVTSILRDSTRDKTVAGHSVVVRELSAPAQAAECQIVFIDKSDEKRVDDYVAKTAGKPILTVSDGDNFTKEGGIIRVFEQANKPKIEINVDEAARAKISISSKLLSLANLVRDK